MLSKELRRLLLPWIFCASLQAAMDLVVGVYLTCLNTVRKVALYKCMYLGLNKSPLSAP